MKRYKCRVCGKKFNDLMVHLHIKEEELLRDNPAFLSLGEYDVKPDHLKEFRKIRNSINWRTGSEEKCFCGGKIEASCSGNEEYFLVEVSCTRCGFLWDED